MTSYSFILLLIHFLQQNKYLPILQKIDESNREKCTINIKREVKDKIIENFETDVYFETNEINIRKHMDQKGIAFPKNEQLAELLFDFWKYY